MSGGAETSIIPSLQSEASTLSASKSRDIARNGGESDSFASVLDDQSRAEPSSMGAANSSNAQSQDGNRGNGLPPEAAKSAASNAANGQANADAHPTGDVDSALRQLRLVSSQPSELDGSDQFATLALEKPLPANLRFDSLPAAGSQLPDTSDLNGRASLLGAGQSGLLSGALTSNSVSGVASDSVAELAPLTPNSPGLQRNTDATKTLPSALLAESADSQLDSGKLAANSKLSEFSAVSKYSQTQVQSQAQQAGEFAVNDAILARDAAMDGEVSFDGMLLKQGKAITASETIDRMLALNGRQDGQASTTQVSGAAPVTGLSLAPGGAGPQATASTADQFALYHSPAEPEFAEEFTARVQMMAKDGVREARLQLHPAELGRLQVSVTTEGDQARVTFVAETSSARDLIEQNLPRLREMLEEQGLQLAQSDVGQSNSEALADQGADGESNAGSAHLQTGELDSEDAPAVLALAGQTSRIDIHV